MTDDQIEQEIQTKGLTAPRITPQMVEANIEHEFYFTAADAVRFSMLVEDFSDDSELRERQRSIIERLATMSHGGASASIDEVFGVPKSLTLTTYCMLVLRSGFTVTGESACVSPENFNAEIGRKVARQNAISKLWPLMGYELAERLSRQ